MMRVTVKDGMMTVDLTNWDELCNVSDLIVEKLGGNDARSN